jgi:acyl-coenzyme A thioesterase PaaI-like protein
MFGGFQASLADPIAALACLKSFPGCEVWTRHLQLNFIREGRTDLELRFEFTDEQLTEVRTEMQQKGRSNPVFEYGFYNQQNQLCTQITCRVAIRPEGYIPFTRKNDDK